MTVLLLLLFSSLTSLGSAIANVKMTAVPRPADLRRRDANFAPRLKEHHLCFADHEEDEGHAAGVSIDPAYPPLNLGDIYFHFDDVVCEDGDMHVFFPDEMSRMVAFTAWEPARPFLLLTTDFECACARDGDGTHDALLVEKQNIDRMDGSIKLEGQRLSLKDCAETLHVSMGEHVKRGLRRRQDPAPSQAPATLVPPNSRASDPAPSYTFQPPQPTATGPTSSGAFGAHWIDTAILPPATEIAAGLTSVIPFVPDGMILTCKECIADGFFTLESVEFDIYGRDDFTDFIDFWNEGYIRFTANDFRALIDLELALPKKIEVELEARLPSLPRMGIEIAGIVQFGILLELTFPITVGMTLQNPFTFRSGFDVSVPNKSVINLNFGDTPSNSTGLTDVDVNQHPFEARLDSPNVDDLQVDFETAFRPHLVLAAGVSASSELQVGGGVGVYVDVPKLSSDIGIIQRPDVSVYDAYNATGANEVSEVCCGTHVRVNSTLAMDAGIEWELVAELYGSRFRGPRIESSTLFLDKPFEVKDFVRCFNSSDEGEIGVLPVGVEAEEEEGQTEDDRSDDESGAKEIRSHIEATLQRSALTVGTPLFGLVAMDLL